MDHLETIDASVHDKKYGPPPRDIPQDDWYYLLDEVEKHGKEFSEITAPGNVIKISGSLTVKEKQMVSFNFNTRYSILQCICKFYELSNGIGSVSGNKADQKKQNVMELNGHLNECMEYNSKLDLKKNELLQLESDYNDLKGYIDKSDDEIKSLQNKRAMRESILDDYKLRLKNEKETLEREQRKTSTRPTDIPEDELNKLIQESDNVFRTTGKLISDLNEKIEKTVRANISDYNFEEKIVRDIHQNKEIKINELETMSQQISNLHTEIQQIEKDMLLPIKEYNSMLLKFYKSHSTKINDICGIVGIDCKQWEVTRQSVLTDPIHCPETWPDVATLSIFAGISVIGLRRDSNAGGNMAVLDTYGGNEFKIDYIDGLYERNPMYVLRDENLKTYCLMFPRKELIRYNLIMYYQNPENTYWIRNRESLFKYAPTKYKDQGVINTTHHKPRSIVKDADGNIRVDRLGAVPVFSLLLHEQPYTNYSFFSTCRDAIAAHLDLPPNEIATTTHFMREWFDYLCYLPRERLEAIAGDRRIRLPGVNMDSETLQKYIAHEIVGKLMNLLEDGMDIVIDPTLLTIFTTTGAPISACTTSRYIKFIKDKHKVIEENKNWYSA